MDLARAEKNMRLGWILSGASIAVSLVPYIVIAILEATSGQPTDTGLHLLVPWLLPGALAIPLLVLLAVLVVLLRGRSRAAAVLLLALYVVSKLVTFPWLYVYSDTFRVIWALVAILWIPLFIPGVRGTFAYHRLTA